MHQKVVLVTGCSVGGLGHAICKSFAAAGCKVYATSRSKKSMHLLQHGCIQLELDVTDTASTNRVVQQIVQEAGRIDVVVNNAGMLLKSWATETPLDDVRRLMEVNYIAMWAMNQAVAPCMTQQHSGIIVNIGSATGYCGVAQAAAYSASKFAVRGYTDALRQELAPFNVRVMHVAPGFMATQLFNQPAAKGFAKPDSPYNHFKHATKVLHFNDSKQGMGAINPADPQRIANRIVKFVLSGRPPRHYVDGWLGFILYCCGCYAPCWLVDLLQMVRFRLPPLFRSG